MIVRGWLIVGDLGSLGFSQGAYRGSFVEWPDAAGFSKGEWIHFVGQSTTVAVCVEIPL